MSEKRIYRKTDEKKTQRLSIRLTQEEKDMIATAAENKGMSIAEFVVCACRNFSTLGN